MDSMVLLCPWSAIDYRMVQMAGVGRRIRCSLHSLRLTLFWREPKRFYGFPREAFGANLNLITIWRENQNFGGKLPENIHVAHVAEPKAHQPASPNQPSTHLPPTAITNLNDGGGSATVERRQGTGKI